MQHEEDKPRLTLIDDHKLFRKGLAEILSKRYEVTEYDVQDFVKELNETNLPDIIITDISMPQINGYELCSLLTSKFNAKVLVVSMLSDKPVIIDIIASGAMGYVCKAADPDEVIKAIDIILEGNKYFPDWVDGRFIKTALNSKPLLSEREKEFLSLACSDKEYKEIASEMYISPRTVDDYRDKLYKKLNVRTRSGLTRFAILNGIIVP